MELRGASQDPRDFLRFASLWGCHVRFKRRCFGAATGAGLSTHQGAGRISIGPAEILPVGKVRRFQPMSPDRVWVL